MKEVMKSGLNYNKLTHFPFYYFWHLQLIIPGVPNVNIMVGKLSLM